MKRLLTIVSLLFAVLALPVVAQDSGWRYGPTLSEASGDPHPEGNEYMRKFHMELMKHDRDMTLRDGEREIDASLKQCFDCHTVKDERTGDPVTYDDERHFCRTCHDFVSVKVDCFTCHRSTPEGFNEPSPLHARLLDLGASPEFEMVESFITSLETSSDQ
ncbi:MAG: hypothetical protein P8L68_05815 [Paracoccaceae bacterium]|nr:hypothetical protein [Paracoccaceae bacterium]MDG2257992.1 hypothetical protein [Paracoccaceae bacterium]